MASGTDVLSDLDAQPEADQQPGHPDQAIDERAQRVT